MKSKDVKEALLKATVTKNGRRIISCDRVLRLAARLRVPPARLGRMCDCEEIKIRQCKLGCF